MNGDEEHDELHVQEPRRRGEGIKRRDHDAGPYLGVNTVHRRVSVELRLLDTISVSLGVLVVVGVVLRLEGASKTKSKSESEREGAKSRTVRSVDAQIDLIWAIPP